MNRDEIEIHYNIRKFFIECLKPKNKKQILLYEMYSHIFINMLFLKCKYQIKTENFIKKFLKKYRKKIQLAFNNISNNIINSS